MKFLKPLLMVMVLLALPVTASAYFIGWDDVTTGTNSASLYNGQVSVYAYGGNFDTKTGAHDSYLGISGHKDGVPGEINQNESMKFVFNSAAQHVYHLELGMLFPNGAYDDKANEVATVQATSGGKTYTYTLTATGKNTAVWKDIFGNAVAGSTVENIYDAETDDDGLWKISNPFGAMDVDSVLLTVLYADTKGGKCSSLDGLDFSFHAMATPIPGAVWLLGAGLMGLFGLKRRRQE